MVPDIHPFGHPAHLRSGEVEKIPSFEPLTKPRQITALSVFSFG
jgi:hypothetical protein